ncbi:diguanylate cyclase [Tumebacillus sp. ITR2]|uniref:Diguanylate cyclase n=1 Tax=Tumebacillus amylolyticus TaxID=2801339 RepID=A0ABS1JFI1_9BACL|nr:diguanylate cyclase [Tumebacillus amylolyticus]MBL0389049.1 diguanylate cyclase [Tumebacillus amylolyticus]
MSKIERIQQLVETGRKKYIVELDRQIEMLEGTLERLKTEFEQSLGQDIYRSAHRLKGSAPTFGLNRVGEIAEHLCALWDWTNGVSQDDRTESLVPILKETHNHLIRLKIEHEIAKTQSELLGKEIVCEPIPQGGLGRLLLIDDDDILRSYLAEEFAMCGYEVDEAADVQTAKRKLYENRYDLMLLDLMMYPQSGYEMFKFLKEDPAMKWIPLIVLSGRTDVQDKVRCLRAGAEDYVTKPFQFEELEARVNNVIMRNRQFDQVAFRDGLTGAYNRRYFDHQLLIEVEWAKRDEEPIALAFLDIDKFKSVNDTHGHHCGDLVLQGLAALLQQNLRATDLLARYGGEEFVVLMPRTNALTAKLALERVLDIVRREVIARTPNHNFQITFSSGIADWKPGMHAHDLVHLADTAMYQAKQEGRNRVVCAEQG